jgi:hypothetical protein
MKILRTPFGQSIPAGRAREFTPPHPERTVYRHSNRDVMDFDLVFAEWPSRGAMLTMLKMQATRPPTSTDWKEYTR